MAHEKSIGIEVEGKHFNIRTVINGKQVSDDEAVRLFLSGKVKALTGPHPTRQKAKTAATIQSGDAPTRGKPSPPGGFRRKR